MLTLKQFREHVMMAGDGSGSIRGMGYVSGNPDGKSATYLQTNLAYYDSAKDQILNLKSKFHDELHKTPTTPTTSSKSIKEELKVGDKDDDGKYVAKKVGKKPSKLKRKYRGKLRGTTHTGKKAHPINVQPVINNDDPKVK